MSITGIEAVISLISHIYYNMDIVYVIGTGSKWDNNELKYSLRSICKYGKGLGKVFIVGDELPKFINRDEVWFLQWPDNPNDSPYRNVYNKIAAFFQYRMVDEFLLSSDDHFFLQPVDFDHWPVHFKASHMPTEAQINDEKIGDLRYRRVMIDTGKYMEQFHLENRFFEGHTNKLYRRDAWEDLQDNLFRDYMRMAEYGLCTNSPMAATIMKLHPDYPCIKRKDIKLRHLNQPEDWMAIDAADSFSIYDSAISTGVGDFLADLFPEKCRFER